MPGVHQRFQATHSRCALARLKRGVERHRCAAVQDS